MSKNLSLQLWIFLRLLYLRLCQEAKRETGHIPTLYFYRNCWRFWYWKWGYYTFHGSSCQETSCWPMSLLKTNFSKMWFIIHASPKNNLSLLAEFSLSTKDTLLSESGKRGQTRTHSSDGSAQSWEWLGHCPYPTLTSEDRFPPFPALGANFKANAWIFAYSGRIVVSASKPLVKREYHVVSYTCGFSESSNSFSISPHFYICMPQALYNSKIL